MCYTTHMNKTTKKIIGYALQAPVFIIGAIFLMVLGFVVVHAWKIVLSVLVVLWLISLIVWFASLGAALIDEANKKQEDKQ